MFYDKQADLIQKEYKQLLRIIGSLSMLSSDSNIPYLYYRMAENIFCKAFKATNLSRNDISIDASKDIYGIGLKTFLYKNGCCIEKIAEFNKQRKLFSADEYNNPLNLIKTVADLRNERIRTTVNITGVDINNLLYHCVVRNEKKFSLYETKMDLIDIPRIQDIQKKTDNTIYFNDKKNEYCFNISKSTLFKKFYVESLDDFDVPIFDDPYEILYNLLNDKLPIIQSNIEILNQTNVIERVILPLYSTKERIKQVPDRSGLNQWNAKGRVRDINEIYIPIPAWIHRNFPQFFPNRDVPFQLILPNRTELSAKICQDGGKALMTNPNKDLGKWLLRQVLHLKEGELLTYSLLEKKGIDSIEISKNTDGSYNINFKQLGCFEEFESNNK